MLEGKVLPLTSVEQLYLERVERLRTAPAEAAHATLKREGLRLASSGVISLNLSQPCREGRPPLESLGQGRAEQVLRHAAHRRKPPAPGGALENLAMRVNLRGPSGVSWSWAW